ncbi:hypothetical protein OUZ56_031746 [Daphnia magna]|uniref:Uncharacterized protein n=1 Tax=Daphnia magna TaxID=35525 RepID=A0ABQ9ZVJ6_9CRUS|nr:hypothetical protein OUZ56_031746 [Daphnia magna]
MIGVDPIALSNRFWTFFHHTVSSVLVGQRTQPGRDMRVVSLWLCIQPSFFVVLERLESSPVKKKSIATVRQPITFVAVFVETRNQFRSNCFLLSFVLHERFDPGERNKTKSTNQVGRMMAGRSRVVRSILVVYLFLLSTAPSLKWSGNVTLFTLFYMKVDPY